MAEVMDPYILESGLLANDLPRRVQVGHARAGITPGKDPGVVGLSRQIDEDLFRCRGQRDGPHAGFPVRQSHLADLEVQVVPAQSEDFVAPASGQHEEADGRRRMSGGQMFRGCGPERLAEPVQLLAGQEALVLLNLEARDAPARVGAGGTPAARLNILTRMSAARLAPVGMRCSSL